MSKVKSDKLPHYELLYLVSNKYSETELDPIKEKVTKAITAGQGVITYEEFMGKRRLAYAIKGYRYGYYQVLEFDLPGAMLAKLDKDLKLDHEILRHQIIRKAVRSAEELAQAAEARRRRQEAQEALMAAAAAPVAETKTEKPVESSESVSGNLESAAELDSKLDKILDSDILYK